MKKFSLILLSLVFIILMLAFASCDDKDKDKATDCVHTFGAWETVTAATCKGGTQKRTCAACGEVEVKDIPAVSAHIFGAWTEVSAATCGKTGTQKRTCTICSAVENGEILATGEHNFTNKVCTTCGEKEPTAGLSYTLINNDIAYEVSLGTASDTDIVIPATYKGKPVVAIAEGAFADYSSLQSITIPSSVTSIGYEAFEYCSSLEAVTFAPNSQLTSVSDWAFFRCSSLQSIMIPSSVTSIGDGVSCLCSSLQSITIPSSVTTVGEELFFGCSSLESITIPSAVTSIGNYAFEACSSLTSITIPSAVTSIGESAFRDCSSLVSVTFGKNSKLTSIGEGAFAYCKNLVSVALGDNNQLTSIGMRVFYDCHSLVSITIPSSVTSIGEYAFFQCYQLIEVYNLSALNIIAGSRSYGDVGHHAKNIYTTTSGTNNFFIDENGYVFYVNGNARYLMNYTGKDTELNLPESCNGGNYEIYQYAFYWYTNLVSITIPSSVTSIGCEAFAYCRNLVSATFGENSQLTSIGRETFWECNSLETVACDATGWWVCYSETATSGTAADLTVTNLTDTYSDYYWKRG